MKLIEFLPVIDSAVVLELENKTEIYTSKTEIPETWMNLTVTSIKPDNNSIRICLLVTPKPKTLEELGFSFEAGV
jgi:hypothetical protein